MSRTFFSFFEEIFKFFFCAHPCFSRVIDNIAPCYMNVNTFLHLSAKKFRAPRYGVLQDSESQFSEISDIADKGQRLFLTLEGIADALDDAEQTKQRNHPADAGKSADEVCKHAEEEKAQALLGMIAGILILRSKDQRNQEQGAEIANGCQSRVSALTLPLVP